MAPMFYLTRKLLAPSLFLLPAAVLTGCGMGNVAGGTAAGGGLTITGHVMGGQQPVGSSSLQLWAAGTGGNGTAATAMVPAGSYFPGGAPNCNPATQSCNAGVVTDAGGGFTLTGDYTCAHASDQVYITATGGNPGLSSGTNNASLLLMTALGRCGNLTSSTDIAINEITTAGAVWALAPFLDQNGNIASSSTNSAGLGNAFLNAELLVDSSSGYPAALPAGLSIETGKLYALANALASCVNSDGTAGCQPLFSAATPLGGSAPVNTVGAALNIVHNTGIDPSAVLLASSPIPPFPSSLTTPPSDWTMSLTVSGGGLNYPSALHVDGLGNVWVAGYFGALSGFSPQGAPLSPNGFGQGVLADCYGLVVDAANNIWVTNEDTPGHGVSGSVTKFNGVSSGATLGTVAAGPYLYGSGTDYPLALAADSNGNVLSGNFGNSTATLFNSAGAVVMDGIGAGGTLGFPQAVAFDSAHGMWITNNDSTISHFDLNGNLLNLGRVSCCNGADGIATDAAGNAWVANYEDTASTAASPNHNGSVSEVSNGNAVVIQDDRNGGIVHPAGMVIDAAQNVWVANFRGASISELAGNANTLPAGTGMSPANGYGQDAELVDPFGIAVDASGNVWVSNFNASTVTMFFGLATPTATPVQATPIAP